MIDRSREATDQRLLPEISDPPSPQVPRWWRVVTSDPFLGVILTVLAWPYNTSVFSVPAGLDASWRTTMAMAAHNGMPVGTHIVFTYGPLGFLGVQQMNYLGTALLAFSFALILSVCLFMALVWSLRRVVPLAVAVVAAYLVGATTFTIGLDVEYGIALVLVICVALLSKGQDEPMAPLWIWAGLGVVFSAFSLLKVSLFPGILAVVAVTVACLPNGRRRAIEGLAIGVVPTFCLGWFGTGNSFGNVFAFAKGAAATIAGYSSAASIEVASRAYTYWLAALVVIVMAGFVMFHVNGLSRRSRVGIWVITAVTVWMIFKEGFVRHDTHDLIFFALAPLVLSAFAPRKRPWLLVPGMLVLTGVFAIAAASHLALTPRPDLAVRNLSSETTTFASSGRYTSLMRQSRQSLRATYALPTRMVAMMQGQTVDVSPWEQNVAWAYPRIRFDPLPVIQDYSAYTPSLDQLDANYLASADAPRFILRQPGMAADGRNPAFEPPTTQVEIDCRYHQVAGDVQWQLLERGEDRCGQLRYLETVSTGFGHWVAVPPATPGDAVIARFRLSLGWFSSLEALVFKPGSVYMQYDGSPLNSWRFITATAPDLHLLRAPSTLNYYRGFVPPPVSSLRFTVAGGYPTESGVKVSFYRLHEKSAPGGNGEVLPPLVTKMLRPANGETVKGTVLLDAKATDYFALTGVHFYLSGPSFSDRLIGQGVQSLYGWLALWNTTKLANGTYTLHSVVNDSIGRTDQSDNITVTVSNG